MNEIMPLLERDCLINIKKPESSFRIKFSRLIDLLATDRPIVSNDVLKDPDFGSFNVSFVRYFTCGSTGSSLVLDQVVNLAESRYADIIVAPEYSVFPDFKPLTREQLEANLEELAKASSKGSLLVPGTFIWQDGKYLRNTCFAFYDGEVIFNYDKKENGGESNLAKRYNLTWFPGDSPGVFSWRRMRIGVEICADNGRLVNEGIKDLDVAMLLSCGVSNPNQTLDAVKINGHCIFVDGLTLKYGVVKRKDSLKNRIYHALNQARNMYLSKVER